MPMEPVGTEVSGRKRSRVTLNKEFLVLLWPSQPCARIFFLDGFGCQISSPCSVDPLFLSQMMSRLVLSLAARSLCRGSNLQHSGIKALHW